MLPNLETAFMPEFDPQFLAALMFTLGACVWLYNQVMVATGKRKPESPLKVELEEKFVSKGEHEKHAVYVEGKLVTAAISRKRMHEDIESLNSRTARLEEQNRSQTDQINLLSRDFRDFRSEQNAANTEILKRLPK